MAEMVGVVASAVAQEGVSGVSSYISNKLEEKASAGHGIERLEMALSQVEFVLERTGKLPITYISLLRRRKLFEQAYNEGTSLLNKQHGIGQEEEHLSSSVVRRFEWLAECADKFVRDVESGCPLRNGGIFRYPLERHLLEGKTLMYEMVRGSQSRYISIWPVCSEGRGVEVELYYSYEDRNMEAKNFYLTLKLRISQAREYMLHSSTDEVVGINAPLLYLNFFFMPHMPEDTSITCKGKGELINGGSIQLMEEMARSKAIDCLLGQPGTDEYNVIWHSSHGKALICLEPVAVPRPGRRAAKRRRTSV